jgi:hypothetical protein
VWMGTGDCRKPIFLAKLSPCGRLVAVVSWDEANRVLNAPPNGPDLVVSPSALLSPDVSWDRRGVSLGAFGADPGTGGECDVPLGADMATVA